MMMMMMMVVLMMRGKAEAQMKLSGCMLMIICKHICALMALDV